jgi:hypothetical protein
MKLIKNNIAFISILIVIIDFTPFDLFSNPNNFFRPDTTVNKMKTGLVAGSSAAIFTSALLVLNQYWYKDYPRSKFHFFDDGREWQGIDKAGHVYNAYVQSRWSVGMYRWAGLTNKQAIWAGGATGIFLQSSIEILDGFSKEWGFSWWDFGANAAGSAIVVGQELLWKEQRITLKVSAFPQNYPSDLQHRADKLYGTTTLELFLKDYNALTTWASFNIHSFIKRDTKFPKWINAAFGYGAQGMYGGFENKWCLNEDGKYEACPDALRVDRSDIQRYKQYYLSFDVDWTKIPVMESVVQHDESGESALPCG